MRNKYYLFTMIFSLILIVPLLPNHSKAATDFRTIDFNNRGFDIKYEIVQGENIDDMFTDLGFDVKGSLSKSEFHVVLKNRKHSFQDIYLIESDEFIPMTLDLFIIENYIITTEPLQIEMDTNSDFITDFLWFDYEPVEEEIIQAEIPEFSSIFLPKIFSNITRPNFAALVKEADYFNFLPFILGDDYNRYEAEFTALLLNQSFSINIFNQDYDEFMLSLDMKLDTSISLRASWDKASGLLKSFSFQFAYGGRSSVFVLSLVDFKEIISPAIGPNLELFITNSSADYVLYRYQSAIDAQLSELTNLVNLMNQTIGVKYQLIRNALEFEWDMLIFDKQHNVNSTTTPLHQSVLEQFPPVVIPLWDRYIGVITLIESLWEQMKDTINGYQFIFTGTTSSLYTIRSANMKVDHQIIDSVQHVIWEISYDIQENNTQLVDPRIFVQESQINISGWLAYSNLGRLEGFALFYQKDFHSFHDYVYDDPSYIVEISDYVYDFYIESEANNLTIPAFQEVEESNYSFLLGQIIFYCILTYSIYRKRKRKRKLGGY
ncbi:MAG: hypothetical protein KAS63_05825 [Candidatus Heimdallarchaeota archaeon]|nr:hypothetical protein [Candidatus Heimdallarchaeota archaeon]MCK4954858.1 hypothetical protein [Candidatus Heimdallarchaeota archaeon]